MIKKLVITAIITMAILSQTQAKKVKFSVNMKGQTISANGIHVAGDFQTLAGYPNGDWNSATTPLTRETADTNIYSVVVDIPAHRKYEYKFVNGDLFYEVEFVPDESRVGYDFSDNRWFYLDSLSVDTSVIGPLMFGGNAPEGLKLFRVKVDMKRAGGIHANGVFVGGNFNNYNYSQAKMYSFTGTAFEYYTFVKEGDSIYYHFSNGNTSAGKEVIPGSCAINENRYAYVNADLVLDSVCFSTCSLCTNSSGLSDDAAIKNGFEIFPNPAHSYVIIRSENGLPIDGVQILDIQGALVAEPMVNKGSNNLIIDLPLVSGVYFVRIKSDDLQFVQKILLNR